VFHLSQSRLLSVAICAACVLLIGTVAAAADTNNPASELNGTWKLVSVEREGEEMQRDDDVRWVIKDGQVSYSGEPLAAMVTYAAFTPKGIDLAFHAPKNDYEGIYVLDNDELKICLNIRTTGPKDRPFDFATREKSNFRVLKFERIVPPAAGPVAARGYIGMALAMENEMVMIQGVLENSPAEKAGLQTGDVLVSLAGQPARGLEATVDSVRRQTPGSNLTIRVLRGGQEKELTLRAAAFPFALLGILA
jgi:uncharacterized protein (TIGR03067 family)